MTRYVSTLLTVCAVPRTTGSAGMFTRKVLQIRYDRVGFKCCSWLLVSPSFSHFSRAVIQFMEICISVFDHTAQERESTGMFFVCLAGRRQFCYKILLCCDPFVSEYRHLIILTRFNWLLNVFVPVVYILTPVCLHILKCNLFQILSYCLCTLPYLALNVLCYAVS